MDRWKKAAPSESVVVANVVADVTALVTAGQMEAARSELLWRLCHVTGAVSGLWCVMNRSAQSGPTIDVTGPGPILRGLDEWQYRQWQQAFLEQAGFAVHPMTAGFLAQPNVLRSVRRCDVVSDSDWRRSEHAEWLRGLGLDDVVAASVPARPEAEIMIAFTGASGEPSFDERSRSVVERVHGSLGWCYQAMLNPLLDDEGRLRRAGVLFRLPPRLQPVLKRLLTGASEKQIAGDLNLSSRSLHKYVEQLYRALGVGSRAELMALWIERAI